LRDGGAFFKAQGYCYSLGLQIRRYMFLKKKRQNKDQDREQDFQTCLDVVKKFDKKEFNRFWDGIKKAWEGYDVVLRTQTREEKETEPVSEVERYLEQQA
jgi:glycine betaine/choline ABC-type transport system substrate-binding protein